MQRLLHWEQVNLSCNNLGVEGGKAIAKAISSSSLLEVNLSDNRLCGVWNERGQTKGTYTSEGITKLCEGLKGSSITSLRRAAAFTPRPSVNAH